MSRYTEFLLRLLDGRLAATLVVLLAISGNASALGLGQARTLSVINQPLVAEIELTNIDDLSEAEIIAVLATEAEYERAGVAYDYSHSDLIFSADLSDRNNPVVRVTTRGSFNEPYLEFVMQLRWPSGRLLRRYTLLLDFPVFTDSDMGAQHTASAPAAPSAPPRTAPQTQSVPVAAAQPSAQSAASSSSVSGYRAGPSEYLVNSGETLWSIGGRIAAETGVDRYQAMIALQRVNPDAFIDGDINQLKGGVIVRLPSANESARLTSAAAYNQFQQQLDQVVRTPTTTRLASVGDTSAAASSGGQFRLVGSDDASGEGSGSALVGQVETNAASAARSAALEEQLDAERAIAEDLRQRLANMEEQNAIMQEALLQLRNEQGARAIEAVSATEEPAESPVETPAAVETPPTVSSNVSTLDKLMGWLPLMGGILIALLLAFYVISRRKQSQEGEEHQLNLDAEEPVTEAPISAPAHFDDVHANDPISNSDESLEDFDLGESADEDSGDDFASTRVFTPTDEALEPAANVTSTSDDTDDWGDDFDDLDAFFGDDEPSSDGGPVSEADSFDTLDDADSGQSDSTPTVSETPTEDVDPLFTDTNPDLMVGSVGASESNTETELDDDALEDALDFDIGFEEPDSVGSEPVDSASATSEEGSDEVADTDGLDFDLSDFNLDDLADEQSVSDSPSESDEEDLGLVFDSSGFAAPEVETERVAEPDSADDEQLLDYSEQTDGDSLLSDLMPQKDEQPPESEDLSSASELAELDDADLGDFDFQFDDESDLNPEPSIAEPSADAGDVSEPSLAGSPVTSDVNDADTAVDIDTLLEEPDDAAALSEGADFLGEFDDLDLGDDSLDMAEECETKLELAQAYLEMGDRSGAEELLTEVKRDGNQKQIEIADRLLAS